MVVSFTTGSYKPSVILCAISALLGPGMLGCLLLALALPIGAGAGRMACQAFPISETPQGLAAVMVIMAMHAQFAQGVLSRVKGRDDW